MFFFPDLVVEPLMSEEEAQRCMVERLQPSLSRVGRALLILSRICKALWDFMVSRFWNSLPKIKGIRSLRNVVCAFAVLNFILSQHLTLSCFHSLFFLPCSLFCMCCPYWVVLPFYRTKTTNVSRLSRPLYVRSRPRRSLRQSPWRTICWCITQTNPGQQNPVNTTSLGDL